MGYKIAFIGAGSVVFSKNLTGDFLQHAAFKDATFTYMDIDRQRLDVGADLCAKVAKAVGDCSPTIERTMDQVEALRDADFVVCMVQVGGFDSTLVDFEIPRKYGLNFTIADTTGPGGFFRALRTFPFMRQLGLDIMRHARPGCCLLQYSNPMSMNMRALNEVTDWKINAVGLCHSVQGTLAGRARDLELPEEEIRFQVAGINHMAFFTELSHNGRDLYRDLFEKADEFIARGNNPVRYELMKRLGYFVTESSEHNAEYNAHFMPHAGLIDRFRIPLDEYLRRCDGIVDEFQRLIDFSKSDEPIEIKASHEYGSVIANAIATDSPAVVYGNLPNFGAIPNLPDKAIVETPTLVDANGCQPTRTDPLPAQLVSYMMPHVTQHELFARAAVEGDRDAVYQAAFADPLTAATLPMDKIVEMCDELIAAHGDLLPPLKIGRLPTSGKRFTPPTPAELRASWDEAKKHTSDEDVVRNWHVAGPFPAGGEHNGEPGDEARAVEAACLRGEAALADAQPAEGPGAADWAALPAGDDDQVEMTEALNAKAAGMFLARATLDSVHDRAAGARFRTNPRRHCVIWLNGRQVFEGAEGRELSLDLRQGRNEVLVRLGGATTFSLYVTKANF